MAPGTSLLEDANVEETARNIASDGIATGLRLRRDVVQKLCDYSSTALCFGNDTFQHPFDLAERSSAEDLLGRKLTVGHLKDPLKYCPTLAALVADPTLVGIARRYLGTEPVLLGARMWWSFPVPIDAKQQMSLGQGFHYDLDGYRALAFFFYLTDVDSFSGPHICVRGSHIKKPMKGLLSLAKGRTDAEIAEWYGPDRQLTVCGPAGSGFGEDIFCYHKGSHPAERDRLILQIRYGLRKYGD